MAGSVLTQSLSKFTITTEPGFEQPFILSVGTVKWSVASDRKWVVCVRGGGPFKPPKWPDEIHEKRLIYFNKMLAEEPAEDVFTVPLADLLTWAQQQQFDDGQITVGCVLGLSLNVQRLAFMLDGLPFKSVQIWDASEPAAMSCLGLSAGGGRWKAFLAGFPLEEDDAADIEDFDPAPEQTAFNQAMGMSD
jgi:hypothetical protein